MPDVPRRASEKRGDPAQVGAGVLSKLCRWFCYVLFMFDSARFFWWGHLQLASLWFDNTRNNLLNMDFLSVHTFQVS